MSFWIYVLRCADGSYYTGHTDNLEKRIGEHQNGLSDSYTTGRLPVELAFSQECSTREEALAAEQQIKGWSRKKKEAMMRGDWAEVSRLAKGYDRDGVLAHPSTSLYGVYGSFLRDCKEPGWRDIDKHLPCSGQTP